MSRLDLIAGPNGAGMTTLHQRVIRPARPGLPFVNADLIARDRFPGEELANAYEATEIAAGGHDVPAGKLASRYQRLWPLVAAAAPHCHRAVFWNNAVDSGPIEVASYRYGTADYPPRWPTWTPQPLLER